MKFVWILLALVLACQVAATANKSATVVERGQEYKLSVNHQIEVGKYKILFLGSNKGCGYVAGNPAKKALFYISEITGKSVQTVVMAEGEKREVGSLEIGLETISCGAFALEESATITAKIMENPASQVNPKSPKEIPTANAQSRRATADAWELGFGLPLELGI